MAFRKETRIIDGVRTLLTIDLTDEEVAAEEARVAASIAAKEAAKVPRRVGTFTEFMDLFSDEVQAAIDLAAVPGSKLSIFIKRGMASNHVDLTSQNVSDALDLLVAGGLQTEAEKAEKLATDFDLI